MVLRKELLQVAVLSSVLNVAAHLFARGTVPKQKPEVDKEARCRKSSLLFDLLTTCLFDPPESPWKRTLCLSAVSQAVPLK